MYIMQSPLSCTGLWTLDNVIPTQSNKSIAEAQALFDMSAQELVGVMHSLDSIHMNDFPLLSKLKIKFSIDFYLCALKRE